MDNKITLPVLLLSLSRSPHLLFSTFDTNGNYIVIWFCPTKNFSHEPSLVGRISYCLLLFSLLLILKQRYYSLHLQYFATTENHIWIRQITSLESWFPKLLTKNFPFLYSQNAIIYFRFNSRYYPFIILDYPCNQLYSKTAIKSKKFDSAFIIPSLFWKFKGSNDGINEFIYLL